MNIESILLDDMPQKYNIFSANAKENLTQIIHHYFSGKPMFTQQDIKIYYYDDLTLKTFVGKEPHIVLYVEIDQPKNFKQSAAKKFKKYDDKIKETVLSLKTIKDEIYELLQQAFSANVSFWQDNYAVNFNLKEDIGGVEYNIYFKIIFAYSYKNENGKQGIIYYNNNKKFIEIEYPKLAITNYNKKSKDTKNLYHAIVLMFKNAFMEQKQITDYLPSEVFETLLYNVPNKLYVGYDNTTIINIINYLRNADLNSFITIDEQDYAFTSKYKGFSKIYAKHVIKQVENFFNKMS